MQRSECSQTLSSSPILDIISNNSNVCTLGLVYRRYQATASHMKPRSHQRRSRHTAKRVGIARYRAEDWSRWLATVDDKEKMQHSHAAWLRDAMAMAERLRQSGLEVVWVDVEPDSF